MIEKRMSTRISRRIDVQIKAEIVFDGISYAGSIKNVSENGLGYLITSSLPDPEKLAPLKIVQINFQTPSGKIFNLSGKTVWFSKTLPYGKTLILGVKIIDPPQSYKEWIKKLD